MIKIVKGNLLDAFDCGDINILIHGCNCFNTMGSGVARQIKERYPIAYEVDSETQNGDISKLGHYSCAIMNGKVIVNAYTQFMYGNGDDFRPDSFRECLERLASIFGDDESILVGMPWIGCGLGGSTKDIVLPIIQEAMWGFDVTIYEL